MDRIREFLRNPLYAGLVGLVIGLLVGWMFLGWVIWPVTWVNANPEDLRQEAKVEYLRMAIEAFGQNQLADKAKERYDALGEDKVKILEEVAGNPERVNPQLIQSFYLIVEPGGIPVEEVTSEPGKETTAVPAESQEKPQEKPKEKSGGFLGSLLPILCVGGLIIVAVVLGLLYFRNRAAREEEEETGGIADVKQAPTSYVAEPEAYTPVSTQPPMARFTAAYKMGDDLFDDTFSIDSPSGEFLGECGVGIAEPIGVGEPKRVTAFEVWLFDKNDIQTVTKVLMSGHAYEDEALRQRLAAKGEPVLISPGKTTELDTQTLHLVANVVNVQYGEGPLPEESYFERFTLELSIWTKN